MRKIGLIGLSYGNGHPYSWSAICNGYDIKAMSKCPFPAIPAYLSKREFPQDKIKGVQVSHVWCDNPADSKLISKSSLIPEISTTLEELCDSVDAILLARDDAENHLKFAKSILKFDKPVFIDKPLAFTLKEAEQIISLERYEGQVFTCSSLRFAKELLLNKNELKKVTTIVAQVPKDWRKYSIHVIEPIVSQFPNEDFVFNKVSKHGDKITVDYYGESTGIYLQVTSLGAVKSPIQITYMGDNFYKRTEFQDAFSCFKKSIQEFLVSVKIQKRVIPLTQTFKIMKMIEKGCK